MALVTVRCVKSSQRGQPVGRRIKVRVRSEDDSMTSDPKTLRIRVLALERKLKLMNVQLKAAQEQVRAYRRQLEGTTGASRPSPEHHPSRNIGAEQIQTQVARRAALLARAVEGLDEVEVRPVPPPPPPRPSREGYEDPYERPTLTVRNRQGRVMEQSDVFRSMSDAEMAAMRQRDQLWVAMKLTGYILFALISGVALFFFDAQAIYEWYTK